MAEKLTDIELSDIQLHDTKARSLARDPANVIVQVSLIFILSFLGLSNQITSKTC